jgi:oxaloacetate decarboxylase alpha subunit
VRSFWIYDVLFNIDKMHRLARVAKETGAQVAGAVMFALSPVHTDAFFAAKAAQLAAFPDIDSILLYDTAGVLDKERLTTLVPLLVAAAGGKPLEMHSNNLLGMSAKAYLDAVELGVTVLHTASRPMANGPSVPSTEIMVRNIELKGHTHRLDARQFAPVAERFEAVGKAAGFLVNQSAEYDVFSIEHQIPGGMMGTFKAQLRQLSGHGDAVQPAGRHPGGAEHCDRPALFARAGGDRALRGGTLRADRRAGGPGHPGPHHGLP